jgi:hypothetical protein
MFHVFADEEVFAPSVCFSLFCSHCGHSHHGKLRDQRSAFRDHVEHENYRRLPAGGMLSGPALLFGRGPATKMLIAHLHDSTNLRRLCEWESKGEILSESIRREL